MNDNLKRKTINRGIKNWAINCLRFYYQRTFGNLFFKRNRQLWVFSAWEGTKYSDNSKYLFEYVEREYPQISCYWITKNTEIYKKLKEENHNVCLIGTAESTYIQQKAGVAIYAHGLDDFGDWPHIYGAFLVCLWHAAPVLKKNYYTRDRHGSRIKNDLAKVKAIIFSYIYRDLTIATSKYAANNFRLESLTKKDIAIIGQPRNDVVINSNIRVKDVFSESFIKTHQLDDRNYCYIAYLPTYRGSKKSQKFLEEQIRRIINNEELNDFLELKKTKLLMKMHYLTDISDMEFTRNIIFLDDRDVEDTQKLLALSKLLITDYSSCSIDFALKNLELLFFVPDLETYEKENGLYKEIVEIINPYRINNVDELVRRIEESIENDFQSTGVTERVNYLYNSNETLAGNYCCEVTKYILDKIK